MQGINLSPRELRMFVALANTLSFTAVAQQFHVTQPTMSKLIANIEEKIGTALFERSTRQVTLTAHGRELLSIAQRVIADYDAGLAELAEASRRYTRQLSIAALPTLVARLLPTYLQQLQTLMPQLSVRIHDTYTNEAFDLLRLRRVDMALVGMDPIYADLEYHPLFTEPLVLLVSTTHDFGMELTSWSAALLSRLPIISMPRGTGTRSLTERAFADEGLGFTPKLEFYRLRSIAEFVRVGAGVGVLPRVGGELLEAEDIQMIELVGAPTRDVGLVMRNDFQASDAARQFLQLIRADYV